MKKIFIPFAVLFLILGVAFGSLANANNRPDQAVTLETPLITDGPDDVTSDNTPTFTFSGPSEAEFYCQIIETGSGDENFQNCSSPYTSKPLEPGEYEFQVYASANRGEDVSEAAYYNFEVLTSKPNPPTLNKQFLELKLTNENYILISFKPASGVSGSFCQLDSGEVQPCRISKYYKRLSHGRHTFKVYSVNSAGVRSDTVSHSWTVDTVKPKITFTRKPLAQNKSKQAVFAWRVSEPVQKEKSSCTLRNTVYKFCSSPKTFRPKRGGNTFIVRVRDEAGNSARAYYSFRQMR